MKTFTRQIMDSQNVGLLLNYVDRTLSLTNAIKKKLFSVLKILFLIFRPQTKGSLLKQRYRKDLSKAAMRRAAAIVRFRDGIYLH